MKEQLHNTAKAIIIFRAETLSQLNKSQKILTEI